MSNKNNTTIKLDEIISKMQLNCIDIDNLEGDGTKANTCNNNNNGVTKVS